VRYDGAAHDFDGAAAIGVSPDGSAVFVTGSSTGSTSGGDYLTLAYDPSTGTTLWARRYDGPGNGNDFATALAVSSDASTVFVTGASPGTTSANDYATIAYDASNGATMWRARYDAPTHSGDAASAIALSPDGSRVFVTGSSVGRTGTEDYATVAYDGATGAEAWTARIDGAAHADDFANAIGVNPAGSTVYVTGSSIRSAAMSNDYVTTAYDAATGDRVWSAHLDGPADSSDVPFALAVGPDGSAVFVTGYSNGAFASAFGTVAYDADTGTKRWIARYEGWDGGEDTGRALGVSPDGTTVYVTGTSEGRTNDDYATVAYLASNGTELWDRRYHGPANGFEEATALGVSPDGANVFVTGSSEGSGTSVAAATVVYDAGTGVKLWSRRERANGAALAYALGVSPDGASVFVTGNTLSAASYYDYLTAAYSVT
jgi:hypothetical protein